MVSLKCVLASLPLVPLATAQPVDIDPPADAGALKSRGYGWLENGYGTEAYRCEYWTNPFFDKIHLAGRNSTHNEREIKDAAKEAGAVTGWKWKDMGDGDFDVRFNLPIWGHNWFEHTIEDVVGVSNICDSDP